MTAIDKLPDRVSFGRCSRNPIGHHHDFVDMGILLGPRRWRCKYCYGGQGELLEEPGGSRHVRLVPAPVARLSPAVAVKHDGASAGEGDGGPGRRSSGTRVATVDPRPSPRAGS